MSTLDYLKQVVKIQSELMVLKNSIDYIDQNLPKLAVRYTIEKPHCRNKSSLIFEYFFKWIEYTFLDGIVGIIITFVALWLLGILEHWKIASLIAFVLISILALWVISSEYAEQIEHIQELWDNYAHKVNEQEERIQKEIPIKNKMLAERPTLINYYNSSKEILHNLYELKINGEFILYPKYRNIVPTSMFIDYLSSHRCEDLGGHEGAYNLYESELRLNTIITNQKIIIENLEQIRENQFCLYETLIHINETNNSIKKELYNISQNIETVTFFSEVSANNTATIAMIDSFRLITDNIKQ